MFALEAHTIFVTLAGSQAHGTARAGSDVDVRGVCIAPLRGRLALFSAFEQYEGALEGALREAVLPPLRSHPTARQGSGTLNRDDQNRLEQSLADKVRSYGIDTLDMPKSTRIAVQERRWSRRSTPSESTERR